MLFAFLQVHHPDEVRADFQQYYALDIDEVNTGAGGSIKLARACSLAARLPQGSRVIKKLNPRALWSDEAYLLHAIEFDLRSIAYGLSDGKGDKPKPIRTPEEVRTTINKMKNSRARALVDSILKGGIDG